MLELNPTYERIKDEIACEYLGPVSVKGKQKEVKAYLVWWQDTNEPMLIGNTSPPARDP